MWPTIIVVVCVLLLAGGILAIIILKRGAQSPVSIVALRSANPTLDEAQVRAAIRRAFKIEAEVLRIPLPDRAGVSFIAAAEGRPPVGVICAARSYLEPGEAEVSAAGAEHPDIRNAIANHVAWISVDAMGSTRRLSKKVIKEMLEVLATLMGEFVDEHTLALYAPRSGRFALVNEKTPALLRERRIDELFGDSDVNAPMIQVDGDDQAINRAIAAAQSRLPELVMEFDRRGPASNAIFKARYPSSNENIWLELVEVHSKHLRGRIANNPVDPSIPAKGALDNIAIEHVVDWAYVDDHGKPQGMFVEPLLRKRGH